jgi:hypothetical protein
LPVIAPASPGRALFEAQASLRHLSIAFIQKTTPV